MNGFETILPFLKPIEHLILDDSISEVMINGPDSVFVERTGVLEQVSGVSLQEKGLMVAVKNIARRLGGDISEAKPILDSRLPDGSRVAAVIPPCSLRGVTLTIRKFSRRLFEIEDLIAAGTIDRSLANRLKRHVLDRKNILLSGGTGSGKTTALNALGRFIPGDERVLVIEDTAEIDLPHANLVRFEARHKMAWKPSPFAIYSRRHSATARIESSSVRSAAVRHSICCSCSIPAIPERFRPSTLVQPDRVCLVSRTAFCRAGSIYPTVPSKPILAIRSISSFTSNAGRVADLSPKSWPSTATTPTAICLTIARSISERHSRERRGQASRDHRNL